LAKHQAGRVCLKGGGTDRDRQAETGTETDGQTPNCTGVGQAPGRPGLKEESEDQDRHTDPGCTGHGQRQAGWVRREGDGTEGGETETAGGGGGREDARAGPMSLGLGPGLKRGWTDRETDPGLHRWWPSTRQAGSEGRKEKGEPGAAGLAEAGMGPSMADADARQPRVEGRRRET
jgi:hypothetical protein